MRTTRRSPRAPAPERIALAKLKLSFSRYVREVQTLGRSLTITQHGRDAAVLAPVASSEKPKLAIRAPLDQRPLGALGLRPAKGAGANTAAITRAIDGERDE